MSTQQTTLGGRTPAQLYALVFGAVLVAVGILGFFADASFGVGTDVEGSDLIIFEVNGWHNLVHLATGAVGLAVAGSAAASRIYCLAYGAVYVLVFLWGVIDGNSVLFLVPVNGADHVLHALLAIAAIGAGLASPSETSTGQAAGARP